MRKIENKEDIIEGWYPHKYLKFVRRRKLARKLARKIMALVGLKNLRLCWESPRMAIRFIQLNNNKNNELVGAEIGTWAGRNAKSILETLPIKKLYLIDPYEPYNPVEHVKGELRETISEAEQKAKKELVKYKDKIVRIKKKSADALNDIPNNLDFIYIDGDHEYNAVKKDIKNYYPKIKKGGVISGHDFNTKCLGVIRAVVEFVSKNNLSSKLQVGSPDWWIVKS